MPEQINEINSKSMGELKNIPEANMILSGEIDNLYKEQQNNMDNYLQEKEKFSDKDDEFEERLKQIEKDREINFFSNMKESSVNSELKNDLMPKTSWEFSQNDNSVFNDRNKINEEIRIYNESTKDDMVIKVEERENKIKQELEERNKKELDVKYDDIVQKIETETKIVPHTVSISSMDRDFKKYPNRYNFQVRFSPSVDEWIRFPIFENNPTKPASKEKTEKGQKGDINDNGFTYNNKHYNSYNQNEKNGSIIGYEQLLYKGTSSSSIQRIYRNIHSIEIKYIIFHVDQLTMHLSQKLITNLLSYPYLLLQIPELDGTISGTSDQLDKSFAQIVPARDYCHSKVTSSNNTVSFKDSGFIHFMPTNSTGKKYFPTPLSILDRLTIRILNPSGEELRVQKDEIEIESIGYLCDIDKLYIYDSAKKEYSCKARTKRDIIEIVLKTYVKAQCFDVGKVLKIKNFKNEDGTSKLCLATCPGVLVEDDSQLLFLDGTNTTTEEKIIEDENQEMEPLFEKFINRPEGHICLGVYNDMKDAWWPVELPTAPTPYLKKIYIQNAVNYDKFIEDELGRPSPILENWVPKNDNWIWFPKENKEVLLTNLTMQNSFVFEVTTNEIDSTTILYGQNQ